MSEREHLDAVRAVFDTWATNGRAEGMEAGHFVAARRAFDILALKPGDRYLDIGCGNGYSVRWAAQISPDVSAIGIDLSEKMIQRAREMSSDYSNCRFINAPFPLPILKAGAFDALLSMEVFYYFPNLRWALMGALRLLKPGGQFACIVDRYTENEASHAWSEQVGLNLNLLSEQEWRSALEGVGFEVTDQVRIRQPRLDDEPEDWRHTEGSLLTLGRKPQDS